MTNEEILILLENILKEQSIGLKNKEYIFIFFKLLLAVSKYNFLESIKLMNNSSTEKLDSHKRDLEESIREIVADMAKD